MADTDFEEFPEDITLQKCLTIIENNQAVLIVDTRKEFTQNIRDASESCEKKVNLEFSHKLWSDNRVKIAKELLERFGEIKVYMRQNKFTVNKTVSDENEIPAEIESVTIEFWK